MMASLLKMNDHRVGLDLSVYRLAEKIALLIALALFGLTMFYGNIPFFLKLNKGLGTWGDLFFAFFTQLGETVPWLAALAVVLWKNRSLFPLLLIAFLLSTFFVQGTKNLMPDVYRPSKAINDISVIHKVEGVELHESFSFPSGHTATAFTICFFCCVLFPNRLSLALGLLYAVLVAYSRVYLSQHFPRDLAGGIVASVLALRISFFFYPLLSSRLFRISKKSNNAPLH